MDLHAFSTPYVIEKTGRGERAYDIYSRLMEERIIFITTGPTGSIDDHLAQVVIAQLLFLEKMNKAQDIHMYINSPGGSVTSGLAIYDTMQFIGPDVATYCVGMAASMGATLLAAGAKGKRYILPNARVMIHQPSGGAQGTTKDMEITINETLRLKRNLEEIMASHTGRTPEEISDATDRDKWMDAAQAVEFGIVDHLVSKPAAAGDAKG